MIWKQFTHLGNFPPELKARFNSFLTTEFDDSLSVEMQLRSIIKWCQEQFKTVDKLIDFINELSNWLKQFETDFDTKLEESVITVLSEWQASGQLDVVISEALQWELDDFKSTTEQNFLSVNQQLQQTEQELSSQLAQITHLVNPTGTANDTSMLNAAVTEHKHVSLTPGIYHVDAGVGFKIPSNTVVAFQKGAILKAIPNNLDTYNVIDIRNVDNVIVLDPYIIGDRDEHTGTSGEWGFGISIEGPCSNITVTNPYIEKCWGDGMYMREIKNSKILNPVIDNCRRNGLTVISCDGLLITNAVTRNIQGIKPETGVDLEPNLETEVIKDLTIDNLLTHDNNGGGLDVLGKTTNSAQWKDVVIKNIRARNNQHGMRFESGGDVTVENGSLDNNSEYGLEIAKDTRHIRFSKVDIFKNGKRGIGATLTSQGVASHSWLFENCTIKNNGWVQANTYDGVRVDSNLDEFPLENVRFINCDIDDDQPTKTQRYGLTMGNSARVKGFIFTGSIKSGVTGRFLGNNNAYIETGRIKFSESLSVPEVPAQGRVLVDIENTAVANGASVVARPDGDVENGLVWNVIARNGLVRLYVSNVRNVSVTPIIRTWHFDVVS